MGYQRLIICSILLVILAAFILINARLFWCTYCNVSALTRETITTFSFGHHGNSELRMLPKLWNSGSSQAFIQKTSTFEERHAKRFLYVTQTERCLPEHFLRPDQLGSDGLTYDILVLSWKYRCNKENKYPNVKYIHTVDNTTWSTGRNILYSHILRYGVNKYLYYIFMDDDVMLYHTEPYQVYHKQYPGLNNALTRDVVAKYLRHRAVRLRRGDNPYREFEMFLLEFQPAVGLLNFCFERREYCISQYIPDVWKAFCGSEGTAPFPYISYSNFDGAFNAFHRDALIHVLPYHVTYEHVNWQESQKYLILEADIKFQGQILYNLLVTGHGTLHRPYPRKIHWHHNWQRIMGDLRKSIDEKYLNELEALPFEVSKRRFDEIRNPLPPRTEIKPYAHFKMNRTRSCHHKPNMHIEYNHYRYKSRSKAE